MSSKRKNRDLSARRRRQLDKGRVPWIYVVLVIVVIAVISGVIYVNTRTSITTTVNTAAFPFACVPNQSLVIHIHPWLQIVINGKNVTIPSDVGITSGASGSCLEPMHTHDASGIIHIESITNTNYTLGKFFQIWNVTYGSVSFNGTTHPVVFNSTDILGYKADSAHKVVLLVDGVANQEDGNLVLNTLDYCNATNSISQSSPCYASAQGNPYYNGQTYPFGTGHTVVIEYVPTNTTQ